MRRFNVFAPEFTYDDSRPAAYKAGSARIGPVIGSRRMVASSTFDRPAVAVFPDSDKIGVWPNGDAPTLVVRDLVDYWHGEAKALTLLLGRGDHLHR